GGGGLGGGGGGGGGGGRGGGGGWQVAGMSDRQVRQVAAAAGYRVLRLVRMQAGGVVLGELRPGQWRELAAPERRQLMEQPEVPVSPWRSRRGRAGVTKAGRQTRKAVGTVRRCKGR
ncbi:MAG: hypothetical protein JXQ71_01700, partial [Verrucomicrobia bacterium]|nr:hypothetical protein [Verrucomicrobiota bacterium]